MITYCNGDLLQAKVECLVNTINLCGVMGKGIALRFKQDFPVNYKLYRKACFKNEVRIGEMYITSNPAYDNLVKSAPWNGEALNKDDVKDMWPHYIINFPTKMHWRDPSKLEWIVWGLADLVRVVKEYKLESIAIPALGCSCGGLQWSEVRPLIENAFAPLNILTLIYNPL